MKFDELNENNYIMFAIKHYDNPQAVTEDDFYEDMKRFKWIKTLCTLQHKQLDLAFYLSVQFLLILRPT